MTTSTGRVIRINGPVVELADLDEVVRFEYVEIGDRRLPGEILTVDHHRAVAQVYDDTSGLTVGEPAIALGHPLTAQLGPGLLGGIYDGLLRPLDTGVEFLRPNGLQRPAADRCHFTPVVEQGSDVRDGDTLGTITTAAPVQHRVLVPPGTGGRVDKIVTAGTYGPSEPLAVIDQTPIAALTEWPIRRPRPYRARRRDHEPFVTGQRVLDIVEPIAKGSSATVIGGFGEGKTLLLEQIAKWSDANVVIYVGCGERGNEMADLIAELSELSDSDGHRLLDRTIILANTSNMPVMAREASIYTAVTIAEYYRDMGLHAVIIADSTSRWAEAQRELASRTGASPAEQGYPADLPTALAAFYQRAGSVITTGGRNGAVTIVTSVSPPGGDITEPVAAHTQRFVQAVWALDRELAYARHYPAVNWRTSFSRQSDAIARWHAANGDPAWATRRARLLSLLAEAARLQGIADLVGLAALPAEERLTLLSARLVRETILQQSAMSENDATCDLPKQAALSEAVLAVHDTASAAIRAGLPATMLETFDFGPLIRAKDDTGPGDADAVTTIGQQLVAEMKSLS